MPGWRCNGRYGNRGRLARMAPWYDYSCSLGHTTESREDHDTLKITCPRCGDKAWRLAVYHEQGIVTESAPSRFTVSKKEK